MADVIEQWTTSGVRMRRISRRPGTPDWLFLPGGPGIGSESLAELARGAELPGSSWLVDLPGDGSNVDPPGAPADPYQLWPQVFLEAVAAVETPVAVGHSTGGEYLLVQPELDTRLHGLVLISSAPNARWMAEFAAMAAREPLAEVDAAAARYGLTPGDDTLRELAVASAPWNFSAGSVGIGRELLARMPYNRAAVDWSDRVFDSTYVSTWWPTSMPTLIISGAADRIVTQRLWAEGGFGGGHVVHRWIDGAGHWPWIDEPAQVQDALRGFAARIR